MLEFAVWTLGAAVYMIVGFFVGIFLLYRYLLHTRLSEVATRSKFWCGKDCWCGAMQDEAKTGISFSIFIWPISLAVCYIVDPVVRVIHSLVMGAQGLSVKFNENVEDVINCRIVKLRKKAEERAHELEKRDAMITVGKAVSQDAGARLDRKLAEAGEFLKKAGNYEDEIPRMGDKV